MYVCCCLAVTHDEVQSAIAGGAHSREAVTTVCRAGGDCGACHGMIEELIEDHLEEAGACAASPGVRPAAHDALVPAEQLVRGRAA